MTRMALAIVVASFVGSLLGPAVLAQNNSPPRVGSYYEGTTNYRGRFFTDREYLKMVMDSRADYWFLVGEDNKVSGKGLAIYDFEFAIDWPLVTKKKLKTANFMGTALDPNVAIMLNPSTSAHKFDVSGVFIPVKPPAKPGDKPQPARVELKFKWENAKADLHLIVGGSPAGSGIPVAVGQPPAEGSVKQDLHLPPMYPFGSDGTKVELQKDPGSGLFAGRDDYDGKGTADNSQVSVHTSVLETINYAAARNPANSFVVSPVGTYEGFISHHARYYTDRTPIGMMLASTADLWLVVDEKGKVHGEAIADYTLDFGVDWTLATKTGISMAKTMGLPIDPSVSVALDPATARQRFLLEGEIKSVRPGAPHLLAPEEVLLQLRFKPNPGQQLRILALGELSGSASPTVAGTTAAAATALGRVVKSTILVEPPPPLGVETLNIVVARRTPYGPYFTDFHYDDVGNAPNTHSVVDMFVKQQPVRAELSACPKEWVPDLMTAAGTSVKFEAKLVGREKKPAKWRFTIEESSRLMGMCTNADLPKTLIQKWQNKIQDASVDLLFDFRRYNGTREPRFKAVEGPTWDILETKEATSDPVQFEVSCLDFGGYGRLIAEADFGYGWVQAVVRQTSEPVAHIPYARNTDEARRHMAQAAKTYRGELKFAGLMPQPDNDQEPHGNGFAGDGLSNFEEYRGFFVREGNQQVHQRLDPEKKDLFIFMDKKTGQRLARHLPDFESASGLAVHRAGNDPLTKYVDVRSRLINLNSPERRTKPQTSLHLTTGDLSGSLVGRTFPENRGFGPPVNVTSVQIDWDDCVWVEGLHGPYSQNFTKSTTIHELGHAVGIRHHGDTNQKTDTGLVIAVEGGQNSGNFACAMRYNDASYVRHFDRIPRSPGEPISLGSLFSSYEGDLHVYEMSLELSGLAFCTDRMGTGLNKVIPNSHDYYCGNATLGDCQGQIVVNDRYGRGSRGSSERQTGIGGPSQDDPGSPPNPEERQDEVEKTAVASQADAGLSLDFNLANNTQREIIPGEAVIFELHVSPFTPDAEVGAAKSAAQKKRIMRLGDARKPWTSQVTFLLLDHTEKLVPSPMAFAPVGKVVQIKNDDAVEGKKSVPVVPVDTPQLRLDADQVYTAGFAADGTSTAKLAAGKYRLFAAVASDEPGLPARVLSGRFVLDVKDAADLPEGERGQAESRRQLSHARLAFRGEKFVDCEKICQAVLADTPDSCEARLLLARALHMQKKFREAYIAYESSLACLKPQLEKLPEPPRGILLAMHALEQELGMKPKPVKLPRSPGPLVEAAFFAETADGKADPPFAPLSRRIVFSWKAKADTLAEPLEARWIAVDIRGSQPGDSLLQSSKSEEGKTSGEFELKAPEGGFTQGTYRLEIGMAGKRLYVVTFAVK